MGIFRDIWSTLTGKPRTPDEPSYKHGSPSMEELASLDRSFTSLPIPSAGTGDESARELIALAQDLCRVVALMADHADPGEVERPLMARLAATRGSALLPLAGETLLEEVYPLASQLQGTSWPGPRLPHDILPRIERHDGHAYEGGPIPEDLYTAAEIGGWLARTGTAALEGLHAYRHNLFRYLSDDSSDLQARVFAMANGVPLGFIAREHGWQRALEFLDELWANAWLMDLHVALILRAALVHCLAKDRPRPVSVAEALDVLHRELVGKYFPDVQEIPRLLSMLPDMQGQIDTGLRHLRHNSRSLTEWLRGIHGLILPANHLAHLLHGAAQHAEPPLVPDLLRRYRFYEEIRADIVGAVEDSWTYVPHALADEVHHQRTPREAKRALKFYCHSRVFIPLALLPPLEKIIDSLPTWPQPEGNPFLRARFAEELRGHIGGGFVQAYELLHPKDLEDRQLALDARWSQLKSSSEYRALPYLGRIMTHQLYLLAGMRISGDGKVLPKEVIMSPLEEDSHHPTVTFPTDEEGHVRRAHVLIRPGSSEARPVYDTSGAAEALVGLLKGVYLAVSNGFEAERFDHVFIAWPELPIQLFIVLEQSKVAGIGPIEVPPSPDAEHATRRSDRRELERVLKEFIEALLETADKASVFAPVVRYGFPDGLADEAP